MKLSTGEKLYLVFAVLFVTLAAGGHAYVNSIRFPGTPWWSWFFR